MSVNGNLVGTKLRTWLEHLNPTKSQNPWIASQLKRKKERKKERKICKKIWFGSNWWGCQCINFLFPQKRNPRNHMIGQ